MNKKPRCSPDRLAWDNLAAGALELARQMPPGPERNEALKLAGQLRSTADAVFPRRVGRESKRHSGCLGSIARRRYAGGSVLTRVEMVALIRASFTIGNHFVWGSHGCASRDKHRVLRVTASSRMGSLRRDWAKMRVL